MSETTLPPNALTLLAQAGWQGASATPMAADWSARRFWRLERADASRAVLVQIDQLTNLPHWLAVAAALESAVLPAPRTLAVDVAHGLLLQTDLGPENAGQRVAAGASPADFFPAAIGLLHQLQQHIIPSQHPAWPRYDKDYFMAQIEVARGVLIGAADWPEFIATLSAAWQTLVVPLPVTFLHRDYNLDNLVPLSPAKSSNLLGIVDFDLAGFGPSLYDVVSLTEQVRRDYPPEYLHAHLKHYHDWYPAIPETMLDAAAALISFQRHLRTTARLVDQPARAAMRARGAHELARLLALPNLASFARFFINHA